VTIARWSVDDDSQKRFAAMTGDHNPIHTDPLVARRTQFGRVAVHGMHVALSALERAVADDDRVPRSLRATFRHSVGVGDQIVATIEPVGGESLRVSADVDVRRVLDLEIGFGRSFVQPEHSIAMPEIRPPEVLTIDELDGRAGAIPVEADADLLADEFPVLNDRIGRVAMSELATLTRLVGMHVPGLHSLLSAFDVHLAPTGHDHGMHFEVTRADERFSAVVIDVEGGMLSGSVNTFVRPRPVDASVGAIRPEPGEFENVRALVIGGSRGLGAITVELLVLGGADVRFTYRTGAADAGDVEARAAGATAYPLDVSDPDDAIATVTADSWQPTLLAYFATPPIFVGARGTYSEHLHAQFLAVYVHAFEHIVQLLDSKALRGILWPSSEAAAHEVPGLAEYGDAKRTGEQLCERLAEQLGHVTVLTPRFPRLLTDQSTSFVPTEFGDTSSEVLAAIRDVNIPRGGPPYTDLRG